MNAPPEAAASPADAMQALYLRGLTTVSGGNISVRCREGFLITPGGVDKSLLATRDIVLIREDGSVEGRRRPSVETPFHRAIYRCRPDLRAIVHAHSAALTVFAAGNRLPRTSLLKGIESRCGRPVEVPYEPPGSERLSAAVARAMTGNPRIALLRRHGALAAGTSLYQALERFVLLDLSAAVEIDAWRLGREAEPCNFESPEPPPECTAAYQPECAVPGNKDELTDLARRLRAAHMLDGPCSAVSRRAVGKSSPATVTIEGPFAPFSTGPLADRQRQLFAAIPDMNFLGHVWPRSSLAFAATGKAPDTRINSEAWCIVGQPLMVDEAQPCASRLLAAGFGRRPVALLAGGGALIAGRTPLEVFDRAEVLEQICRVLLAAEVMPGGARPIHTGPA